MRKYIPIAITMFLFSCGTTTEQTSEKMYTEELLQRDSTQLLMQYWELRDAEGPSLRDVKIDEDEVEYLPGLIVINDSILLENPKGLKQYGNYTLVDNTIEALYPKNRKVVYQILKMDSLGLLMKRTEGAKKSKLEYASSNTYWPDSQLNPFSVENYRWTTKPTAPESDEQIKQRAKECIRFYSYYFKGFVNGQAKKISFEALPNCFEWYNGGIFIQSDSKLDEKFISCFYNKEQALKGRQILEDALMKKYDWDSTQTNWVNQTSLVLQQIYDKM